MDSTPSSKDTNWKIELKRKTQQSVVYKKSTLQTEINITSRRKGGRRFTKLLVPTSRQEY
jgi:hypothetical protein